MKFSSTIVLASFFAVVSAATVATTTESTMKLIMNDLINIGNQFKKADTAITRFPQTGIKGAAEIHDHEAAIHTLFGDVNNNLVLLPRPVSQENVKKIVDTYQSLTPTMLHTLNGITAKASDFVSLNAAPTMSNDLALSAQSCKSFATTVLSMTPSQMTDAVNTMFNQLDTARQDASAALASAGA